MSQLSNVFPSKLDMNTNELFSETTANIAIGHILLKTDSLDYIFCRDMDSTSVFNHFHVIGPKAAEFGAITQNSGRYAVQGHSRVTYFGANRKPIWHLLLVTNRQAY